MLIRVKEKAADRMIIQYTLAEKCYGIECSFISKPFLILENKALKPADIAPLKAINDNILKLLFSGTIAESYGIFDALSVADAIVSAYPKVEFVVAGHCPSPAVFDRLVEEAHKRPWMRLNISSTPIPHEEILNELQRAHFTFVAYRLNPSNEGCMPTRIWEAIAWKTPVIMRKEHPWVSFVLQHRAGFAIDFLQASKENLMDKLFSEHYFSDDLPDRIYWESIEGQWLELVASVCSPDTAEN